MYYCPQCSKPYITDGTTRVVDTLSGFVYSSPSYPACSSLCLVKLQKAGKFVKSRALGVVGAPMTFTAEPDPIISTQNVKKGA